MAINWSSEYKKFKEEQAQIKKECLAAGMTRQEIDEVYSFSKNSSTEIVLSGEGHNL